MGRIHVAPLCELAVALRDRLAIRHFVETGTYQGHATRWASEHFPEVWTVELRADYQRAARESLADRNNIRFVLGDSAQALTGIVGPLPGPALFWLDAHAGGGHFGSEDVCPLLDELKVILASPHQHAILIDDARAFTAPPPPPFDAAKWPSLDQIFRILQAQWDPHVVLTNDCLVCVPQAARGVVTDHVLRVRTKI